jgi:hypothetical protein
MTPEQSLEYDELKGLHYQEIWDVKSKQRADSRAFNAKIEAWKQANVQAGEVTPWYTRREIKQSQLEMDDEKAGGGERK